MIFNIIRGRLWGIRLTYICSVVEWFESQSVHNYIYDPHHMVFRNEIFKR